MTGNKMKNFALTVAAIVAIVGSTDSANAFGGRFFFRCRCCQRCASRAGTVKPRMASQELTRRLPQPQPGTDVPGLTRELQNSQAGDVCLQTAPQESTRQLRYSPSGDLRPRLDELERELVEEAIRVRGRALIVDRLCCQKSRANSEAQASFCQLGHFTGSAYEIAGVGYGSPAAAIQGWLNSPAHRAILLRSDFTKVGAAVRRGRDGRLYWTMNFAR